jgi:hypothetical protein
MRRTRLSLLFEAALLLAAGTALAAAPSWTLERVGSTGAYGDVLPRVLGLFLLALGVVVVQVIRHKADALYPTTMFVRALLAAGLLAVWASSDDPVFAYAAAAEGLGLALTAAASRADRKPAPFGRVGRVRDSVETR